ncbi:proliferating cell nuclear antigen (pcna) [Candidatus Woesearchaeota archaeon]|nr:proliferating cell nuclear antigen (pcna) [Candidatus Woesearchaeota archaeon]
MKLVLSDATHFKDSISIISELVNEARFKITKDGVELVAMDPANVAMVVFKFLSSGFAEYEVDVDQELAINLANFKQVLRRAKGNDIVTFEVVSNKLQIQFKSDSTRTFSVPLLDFEDKPQRVPNLSFPVEITAQSSLLSDAIEDADVVAESVSFVAEPEKFIVQAEGDLSKAMFEIKHGDVAKISSQTPAKIRAKYSIEYLKKLIQGSKLSDEVSIFFNQDYPLKIEYKVVDKLLLSFILAPRVDND